MRGTWKQVNELLGKQRNDIDDVLQRNFEKKYTPEQLVENMADNFQQSIQSLRHFCNIKLLQNKNSTQKQSFYLSKPTVKDISKIIDKLETKKPPGYDKIRVKDIKEIKEQISPIITKLIRKTIETGIIPHKMKISIHRVIYKNGDKTNFTNYRHIANSSIIMKIMEKYVASKLVKYLKDFDIIINRQYSYQKNKDTNKLLKDFTDVVNKKLNTQYHILIMFIDISKCFDSLDFNEMEEALKKVGIHYKWFTDFLKNRNFTVRYRDTYSDMRQPDTGIQQGSILGPYLYLLYTNDIMDYLKKDETEIFIFADDIALITYDKSLDNAEQKMQKTYNTMTKYAHDKKLTINNKKTKIMHIRSPQYTTRQIKIKIHDTKCLHKHIPLDCKCTQHMENVQQYRYLGITIDTKFKFDIHIDNVCKRLRTCSYYIYYLGNYVDYRTLKIIYNALVESIIRYGIESWGGTANTHMKKIENVQKRILKSFHRKKQKTIESNIYKLNYFLPASQLYEYVIIINNFFSCLYKTPVQHEQMTRQITTGQLKIPSFKNEYGKRTRDFIIPYIFNKMPNEIRQLTTYGQIKKQTKDWLLNELNL